MEQAVEPRELSSFFSEGEAKATAVETPPDPTPAVDQPPAPAPDGGVPRVPKGEAGAGRFAAKQAGEDGAAVVEEAAPAPNPDDTPPAPDTSKGLESTALGERRRRQEAERREQEKDQRIQYLESQLGALQQPKPEPKADPEPESDPDFWADPKAFLGRQFDQFGETLLDRFERRQRDRAFDKSEDAARAKYEDYDEVSAAFQQAAAANHALIREMLVSDDPGEFAYRKGKGIRQLSEVGDVEELKAQLREEWEAELRSRSPTPPSLPTSTATERSASVPRTGPAWAGQKPLRAFFDH